MRALALMLAAVLAGPAAAGPALTLNGVRVDGITDQRFENATVIVDENGDVHIEAKGYVVRSAGGEPPRGADGARAAAPTGPGATPPGRPTRRYFLVTEHDEPGTQYDLAVFINAQWIREVKASEPQVVMEITRYLRAGPNRVVLAATKRNLAERASSSGDVRLRVVLGEGNVGGGHVMIENPLLEVARSAAEIEDRTEEYVVEAR